MKLFISQKMRGKSKEEIIKEQGYIKGLFDHEINKGNVPADYVKVENIYPYDLIRHDESLTRIGQNILFMREADIVLVPKVSVDYVVDMSAIHHSRGKKFCEYWTILSPDFIKQYIKGCEFEFLIAKSYGKKVYTYDDAYTFEEV